MDERRHFSSDVDNEVNLGASNCASSLNAQSDRDPLIFADAHVSRCLLIIWSFVELRQWVRFFWLINRFLGCKQWSERELIPSHHHQNVGSSQSKWRLSININTNNSFGEYLTSKWWETPGNWTDRDCSIVNRFLLHQWKAILADQRVNGKASVDNQSARSVCSHVGCQSVTDRLGRRNQEANRRATEECRIFIYFVLIAVIPDVYTKTRSVNGEQSCFFSSWRRMSTWPA